MQSSTAKRLTLVRTLTSTHSVHRKTPSWEKRWSSSVNIPHLPGPGIPLNDLRVQTHCPYSSQLSLTDLNQTIFAVRHRHRVNSKHLASSSLSHQQTFTHLTFNAKLINLDFVVLSNGEAGGHPYAGIRGAGSQSRLFRSPSAPLRSPSDSAFCMRVSCALSALPMATTYWGRRPVKISHFRPLKKNLRRQSYSLVWDFSCR